MRPCWSGVTSWASAANCRMASPRDAAGAGVDLGLEAVGHVEEPVDRPQAEAAVELAEQAGLAELSADASRQDHAALVVEPVLEGPDEAGPLLCHGSLPSGAVVRPAAPAGPLLCAAACQSMPLHHHGQPLDTPRGHPRAIRAATRPSPRFTRFGLGAATGSQWPRIRREPPRVRGIGAPLRAAGAPNLVSHPGSGHQGPATGCRCPEPRAPAGYGPSGEPVAAWVGGSG